MGKIYTLGLTGSIGMGKTQTAAIFRAAGVAVWDADAVVHNLYAHNQSVINAIEKIVPSAILYCTKQNSKKYIDRAILRASICVDKNLLPIIEKCIHPKVESNRLDFLAYYQKHNVPLALFDIPLLYETMAHRWLDSVLLVTINKSEQRRRVLARGKMNKDEFAIILARQMPDEEKRKRADFIIETQSFKVVKAEVEKLIRKLTIHGA